MEKIVVVGTVDIVQRKTDEDIIYVKLFRGRVTGVGRGGDLHLRRKHGHGYNPGDKVVVTVEYFDETA